MQKTKFREIKNLVEDKQKNKNKQNPGNKMPNKGFMINQDDKVKVA